MRLTLQESTLNILNESFPACWRLTVVGDFSLARLQYLRLCAHCSVNVESTSAFNNVLVLNLKQVRAETGDVAHDSLCW